MRRRGFWAIYNPDTQDVWIFARRPARWSLYRPFQLVWDDGMTLICRQGWLRFVGPLPCKLTYYTVQVSSR